MTRFLVVDDSAVIRKVARRMLEALGYAVDEAVDGEDALKACLDQMPDGVLLDWNMPNMDGLSFLEALRVTPGGSRPKVLFCTTENDFDHISAAMEKGADEYLFKPYDQSTLESKLTMTGIAP
jgi:two-component system chemotaxis response regulator CheY